MKYLLFPFLVVSLFIWTGCSEDNGEDQKDTVVISFEGKLTEANSEFKTTDGDPVPPIEYGYYKSIFKDPSNVLEFTHYYSGFGFGGGFIYTNKTDKTTPGAGNNSAITGKGKDGATYLTGSTGNPAEIKLLKPDNYTFKGVWVTNSTYAYIAIEDGKDGFEDKTKFETGDWFKLTFVGYDIADNKIGSVDFFLADYTNGKTETIKDWTWVDLSSIANAETIKFEMSSTDNSEYGGVVYMNTPTYFCLDGITLEEK